MNDSRSLIENPTTMGAFSVWAWREHYDYTSKSQVFNNEVINYDGNISSWTYEYPRSWHFNNTYNFYALYPDTITNAYYNMNGKLTIPRFDVRQNEEYNITQCVDLLKSNQYVDVGMTPPATVNLTFTHMLANVNIDLQKDNEMNPNDKMEVTYILLDGMNCVGSMTDDVWALSEPSYLWDKLDTPVSLKATSLTRCFGDVLMIPQTIAANQVTLYVVYNYTQSGTTATTTKTLQTYLPTGVWKAGDKITYIGTIQVDNSIVFDTPQVESWGTEQVGGTIIIQ